MSHWAELDENNIVIRVLVGDNNSLDEGKEFMESLGGKWVQTSYNGRIRKNFAGISFYYDSNLDAFISTKCHNEAVLIEATCQWECGNIEHEDKTI
jgi:hypothetical protein